MADESTAPFIPYYSFAPENFRKIMNRQMQNHATQAEDNVMQFSKGNSDGRYSSSLPSAPISIKNEANIFYFVVGFTRIGALAVAAP